jgi:hypothetical protein
MTTTCRQGPRVAAVDRIRPPPSPTRSGHTVGVLLLQRAGGGQGGAATKPSNTRWRSNGVAEESARSGIRRRRYAIIQVAAYECKQKELAMRRVKQEVIDLDDD